MGCTVIIQKPDGAYLVYVTGDTFTMPEQFIEWHSNITVDDSAAVPDGTALHPMLTRSDAPVSYFVPFTAGGGSSDLADLLPEGEFDGISFERTGAGTWHVSGTSAVPYPVAKATVEMDGAYAMSGSMTGIGGIIAQARVGDRNVQLTGGGKVVFETDGPKQVDLAIQVTPSDGRPGITVDDDVSLSVIRIGDSGGGLRQPGSPD